MPTRKVCWFRGNCLDQKEVDDAAAGAQHLAVATDLGLDLDRSEALAGWTVTGDVAVDTTKGRQGKGGAMKVGPGGRHFRTAVV